MKINYSLLALAVGAFAIGTTEFSPMGLLPSMAEDLGVSIPKAGMLITGYAIGRYAGSAFDDAVVWSLCPKASIDVVDVTFYVGQCDGRIVTQL